jgi:uncharacterized membrane protein
MAWSHPYDLRYYSVLAAGLVGLLVLAFRLARAPGAKSVVLLILRALAIGILVLILLNPVRVNESEYRGPEPPAVFLFDESRSMGLEGPRTRARAVDDLIATALARVPEQNRPPLLRFGFGRELAAISGSQNGLLAKFDETRLNRALEELPSRFGASAPFAVFLFSDGRASEPESLEATALAYHHLGIPLHVIPVGDEAVSGDVAVQDIDAPRNAQPGTRVPIRVTVRSQGYVGERALLRIRSSMRGRAAPLATLPITLSGGEQAHELVIETDQAKGPLSVEVSPLPHEAIAANNVVPFQIMPRDPKIRVLYMEGTPGSEFAFVRDALHEDPNIECTPLTVDNQMGSQPRLYRVDDPSRGFPTSRQELFSYDVVICSDIARTSFTPEQLDWTVELVGERGGGFAMVGGYTSFGAGGWDQTSWDGLIPIDMRGRGLARSEYYEGPLRVVIPPRAADHPIWRIVDDPQKNLDILARMPGFNGTNLTERLKPAATALGLSDQALPGSNIVTVFSAQAFGRGRSFAMATDTTVGWGQQFERVWGEGDNRYFRKFWRNVVRWLSEHSDAAHRQLRVETDKVIYRPGQEIQVTAHAYDDQQNQTDSLRVAASLHHASQQMAAGSEMTLVNLTPQLDDHSFRGKLTAPPASANFENPGSTIHRVVLDVHSLDGDREVARTSLDLQVIDDPVEFRDPRPDRAQLEGLARATAGRVIQTPAELASLLAQHPQASVRRVVTRSPVWDNPWLWLLFLGLLSAEWLLRRRKGLA